MAENGILYRTKYRRLNYTFQQLLNWGHKYGLHNVEALAGHETYFQKTTQLQGAKSNMFDPHNYELANMITTLSAYSVADSYNNEGWIFRGQYDYDSKYFFSASFRRDASSRFHPKHRWGNFWSAVVHGSSARKTSSTKLLGSTSSRSRLLTVNRVTIISATSSTPILTPLKTQTALYL